VRVKYYSNDIFLVKESLSFVEDKERHAGDLGNVTADVNGRASFKFSDKLIKGKRSSFQCVWSDILWTLWSLHIKSFNNLVIRLHYLMFLHWHVSKQELVFVHMNKILEMINQLQFLLPFSSYSSSKLPLPWVSAHKRNSNILYSVREKCTHLVWFALHVKVLRASFQDFHFRLNKRYINLCQIFYRIWNALSLEWTQIQSTVPIKYANLDSWQRVGFICFHMFYSSF